MALGQGGFVGRLVFRETERSSRMGWAAVLLMKMGKSEQVSCQRLVTNILVWRMRLDQYFLGRCPFFCIRDSAGSYPCLRRIWRGETYIGTAMVLL